MRTRSIVRSTNNRSRITNNSVHPSEPLLLPGRRLSLFSFSGFQRFSFSQHKRSRAFTLLELLVVMGVIGLLMVLIAPAVTTLSKADNLNSGGRLVSNILTTARAEAITRRRLVQVRFVTKWTNSGGAEDTSSSYHKFSVWEFPQADDAQQSSDPNDSYVQISKWETLPNGIIFEPNTDPGAAYSLPTNATNPRYPGTYFLNSSLTNQKTNIKVPSGTADVAFIEFTPTGDSNVIASGRVYLLVTEGFWDGTTITYTHANHPNWFATTIDILAGRINILRP